MSLALIKSDDGFLRLTHKRRWSARRKTKAKPQNDVLLFQINAFQSFKKGFSCGLVLDGAGDDQMRRSIRSTLLMSFATLALMSAAGARANPELRYLGADLSVAPYSFTFEGDTFTFASTGDIFNPLAVSTSNNGTDSSFGGFLGIPIQPTTSFVDRGIVTYGPNDNFSPFPTLTVVPFSTGQNFIGLRAEKEGQSYFGFAYTTDNVLNGYGFENVAGTPIIATAISAAPEPGAWALMIAGVAMLGAMLRFSRRPEVAALGA